MISVDCSWEQHPEPEKHIGSLKLRHSLRLFGFNLSVLDMDVVAKQVKHYMLFCAINNLITLHGVPYELDICYQPIWSTLLLWWGVTPACVGGGYPCDRNIKNTSFNSSAIVLIFISEIKFIPAERAAIVSVCIFVLEYKYVPINSEVGVALTARWFRGSPRAWSMDN